MSDQLDNIFNYLQTLDRKFTTFAQQAGYEFDAEGNATRKGGAIVPKSAKFSFKQALIDAGACTDNAQLFMDARAKKKAVNSEIAFNKFLGSLGKYTVAQAVEICAEEQWKGFKVEWAENLKPDDKKRYSFMELGRGEHLDSMKSFNGVAAIESSDSRVISNQSAMSEFALLEQQHRTGG